LYEKKACATKNMNMGTLKPEDFDLLKALNPLRYLQQGFKAKVVSFCKVSESTKSSFPEGSNTYIAPCTLSVVKIFVLD